MNKKLHQLAAMAALAFASFAANAAGAANIVVDVTGADSINKLGETGNVVRFVDIGANALLTSLDWAVTLNAFAPSSLADMRVSFGQSSGANMIDLAPGGNDFFSGSGSYAGSTDLTGLGIAAGADGLLRIEFSEYSKDFASGVTEGRWVSGSLTFGVSPVPEPTGAVLALLGLGALTGVRRLRRR